MQPIPAVVNQALLHKSGTVHPVLHRQKASGLVNTKRAVQSSAISPGIGGPSDDVLRCPFGFLESEYYAGWSHTDILHKD